MDKYKHAEKELAKLLGWKALTMIGPEHARILVGFKPNKEGRKEVTKWTQNSAHCFDLMVEHGIQVEPKVNHVYAVADPFVAAGIYEEHPDKVTATRFAIVMAVIAKLGA